jgi:choline dehydrogenase-like flavoprotein
VTRFDYDVVIIGSGFGGSAAALRAAEKGYRVGVMEAGRRWKDEDIPKTQWDLPHFLWLPAAELYGIQPSWLRDAMARKPKPTNTAPGVIDAKEYQAGDRAVRTMTYSREESMAPMK